MIIFITQISLIKNEFAPVTFRFGFVEASFPSLCNAFKQWHRDIDAKFAVKTKFSNIVAHLETALPSLQPLTTPLDRYLLVETKSNWTAIFANGLRVNAVFGPVSYLPLRLNCRGLEVGYAQMLERYCRALGIEVNQVDFYGPRSCAVKTTGQKHRGDLSMSIVEANSHLDL